MERHQECTGGGYCPQDHGQTCSCDVRHGGCSARTLHLLHGHRFEAMREDHFRYLPRNDVEGQWQVLAPLASDPTLDTMATHIHAKQGVDEDGKRELRASQRAERRP